MSIASAFTTRPEILGSFGVASSSHWLGAQTAMGVLERGGNAFDAAVAGGMVLQVVEAHLNGPGGEVSLLLWSQSERRAHAIEGQGCAPADATAAAFRRKGLELIPGIGLLAATVPGAFAAWLNLLRDHGSWSLADVMEPAVTYAAQGFPITAQLAGALLAVRDLFRNHWTSSVEHWLPGGVCPQPGAVVRRPALAATYRRVIEAAQSAGTDRISTIDAAIRVWQEGFVAREIDTFCKTEQVWDSTGERNSGLLRFDDMAGWRPSKEAPLIGTYGDFQLAKCGFWSQGPMALQILSSLRNVDIAACEPTSFRFVHCIAEATKLALADRLAWYGRSSFAQPDVQAGLLSDLYGDSRRLQIDEGIASKVLRPGSPLGRVAGLPDLSASEREVGRSDLRFGIGEPTFATLPSIEKWPDDERFVGDTCHLSVIDRFGNMVAATPSGGWLSSSPTIPSLGFSLGTRLQMSWVQEGLSATVTPQVAPLTTLSPSLAFKHGEPYMAFGTPGGDQQDQWQVPFFLRHVVHGMNLQEAIDAPSFHVKHHPASFWPRGTSLNKLHLESRFSSQTLEKLGSLGHEVIVGAPWSEGRICACSQTELSNGRLLLKAAASPRGMQAYAVGR